MFLFAILGRALFILIIGFTTYFLAKAVKADDATTVGIVTTVISIVIGVIDVVAHVYRKIFDEEDITE